MVEKVAPMTSSGLEDVDLELADNGLEEAFKAVVGVGAPIDIVVHLLHGQPDGNFDGLQAELAAIGGQGLQLLLMIVLVHIDGQRLDHLRYRREAIAIAAIRNVNICTYNFDTH